MNIIYRAALLFRRLGWCDGVSLPFPVRNMRKKRKLNSRQIKPQKLQAKKPRVVRKVIVKQ